MPKEATFRAELCEALAAQSLELKTVPRAEEDFVFDGANIALEQLLNEEFYRGCSPKKQAKRQELAGLFLSRALQVAQECGVEISDEVSRTRPDLGSSIMPWERRAVASMSHERVLAARRLTDSDKPDHRTKRPRGRRG